MEASMRKIVVLLIMALKRISHTAAKISGERVENGSGAAVA